MSTILCIILFILFAGVQFILSKKIKSKIARYIPLIVSGMSLIFAIGLHIYARIIYEMGVASRSVLAENQYFAMFIFMPALICLVGSIIGVLLGKTRKSDRGKK